MRKLLKAGHIAVVLLLIVYCLSEIAAFAVKLLVPRSARFWFWKPGLEVAIILLAMIALFGILACSLGILKNPSAWLLGMLHGAWLACYTWFGWFRVGGPFALQELVGINLSDAAEVARAKRLHLLHAVSAYLIIALITSLPLLMRWFDRPRRNGGCKPPGDGARPALQHR
jgi:hypothetical protein